MITRMVLSLGRRQCRLTHASNLSTPLFSSWQSNKQDNEVKRASTTRIHSPWSIKKRCFHTLFVPEHPLCDKKDMAPNIRTCLSGTVDGTDLNTGFHIWFVGTGGGLPSKHRMTSATMLQLGGQSYLFDAGEGLQRQLMFTRQRLSDITKIFITHMHADHVLGLPGILLMARLAGRDRGSTHVIEIYGPPGLYNFITGTFVMTYSGIGDIKVIVYELVGGDADQESWRRLRGKQSIQHGQLSQYVQEQVHCSESNRTKQRRHMDHSKNKIAESRGCL